MTKGERIKKLRKEKGITQEELAKALKTTKQTISKYEKGIVTNIPSDRIEAMCKVLDTTPGYITGWEKRVEEDPVGEANKLADWYMGLEYKETDAEVRLMLEEYGQLNEQKQAQVREYVHFLLGRD